MIDTITIKRNSDTSKIYLLKIVNNKKYLFRKYAYKKKLYANGRPDYNGSWYTVVPDYGEVEYLDSSRLNEWFEEHLATHPDEFIEFDIKATKKHIKHQMGWD
jgi:hypothetical protein